jgi:2-dehydro-3-deoxygluconokinase
MTAMQAAKEAGVCVVLDPNIRRTLAPLQSQVEVLRELCKYADIVLSGEDEALAISGLQEPGTAIAEWFLGQGCRMVAVKLGSRGAWATDGTQTVHQAAFPVRTVDTVGAGDAFAAGFISAILNGRDLPEALRRGAGCGAMNVSVVGDFDGSPTEGQLQTFLDGITDIER